MYVIIFYIAMFAISVFNLWIFIATRPRKNNVYYPIMFLLMAISNSGFFTLALSKTVEGAIIGNRLCYLGGCCLMPCILICVLDLCNIRIHYSITITLTGFSIALYSLILTTGHLPWYYATQEIVIEDGYTRLVRTTGPLYPLFYIHLIIYTIAIFAIVMYAIRRQKTVSYKNLMYILGMVLVTVSMYVSKKIIGYDINLVPLAYAVDGFILLALRRRVSLYDVSSTVADSLTEQDIYGYATFDNKKAFLACNDMAKHIFPEFGNLYVDHALPYDTIFFEHMHDWIDELDETQQAVVHYEIRGDREIKCTTSYIKKDFQSIFHSLGYMIEFFDVTDERKYMNLIKKYNEELKQDVEKETAHVKDIQNKMILGMANMIENRDNSTGGHIKRTSKCIEILVEELKRNDGANDATVYSDAFCNAIIKAAPMHDIGKISVPDSILKKPGRFTPDEFLQMQGHAAKGAELLTTIIENVEDEYFVRIAKNMAHYHHERWNGTGYPEQLKGEEIPLEARIMALADVYDALVSKRCYKEEMSFEDAATIIREGKGTQFDPELVDVFENCREKLEAYYLGNE